MLKHGDTISMSKVKFGRAEFRAQVLTFLYKMNHENVFFGECGLNESFRFFSGHRQIEHYYSLNHHILHLPIVMLCEGRIIHRL